VHQSIYHIQSHITVTEAIHTKEAELQQYRRIRPTGHDSRRRRKDGRSLIRIYHHAPV